MNLHAVSEKYRRLVTINDPKKKKLAGDNLSFEISELIFGVLVAQKTGETNPKELRRVNGYLNEQSHCS